MDFMVEMVVGIKLIRSRLYGGDRGEVFNFLKSERCVCWFLRENASENQIKSLKLQVLAKMKRETDVDIDIDINIQIQWWELWWRQWWELINGLYGEDCGGN